MNHTDERILKLWKDGLTLDQIATKIGRPGNIERVEDALERNIDRLTTAQRVRFEGDFI